MPITLLVTAGPHVGRTFTFDRHDTFLIGRSAEAHFSLPDDPYFSRMHFLVEVNPPLSRLTDLNSHNGTLVNGQKVRVADLQDGDEIRAGRTILRVASPPSSSLHLPSDAAPANPPGGVSTLDDIQPEDGPQSANRSNAATAPSALPGAPIRQVVTVTGSPGVPVLPGYRVLKEIGRGGMGVVYYGICEADGSAVAIKTIRPGLRPDPLAVSRFLREAAILKELRHPFIVSYRDAGEAHGLLYFAMDFVAGTDAAQLVASEGPLKVHRAVGILRNLLDALAYAHGAGFIHRDIKPANLLVSGSAGAELARVADFGLARAYQESALSGLTLSGAVAGTPRFMPPEQITDFRRAKPPADQYSAAATLYHLLTGKFVYDGSGTSELFRKVLLEEPVPIQSRRPDLPEGLVVAVHRALARRPEDRFPDASAFAEALQLFA